LVKKRGGRSKWGAQRRKGLFTNLKSGCFRQKKQENNERLHWFKMRAGNSVDIGGQGGVLMGKKGIKKPLPSH